MIPLGSALAQTRFADGDKDLGLAHGSTVAALGAGEFAGEGGELPTVFFAGAGQLVGSECADAMLLAIGFADPGVFLQCGIDGWVIPAPHPGVVDGVEGADDLHRASGSDAIGRGEDDGAGVLVDVPIRLAELPNAIVGGGLEAEFFHALLDQRVKVEFHDGDFD